jgi:3-dehydroquinate synthase
MSETLQIKTGQTPYPVHVGEELLEHCAEMMRKIFPPETRIALLSSRTVEKFYRKTVEDSLQQAGYRVNFIHMPSGEAEKKLSTVQALYDTLLNAGLDRSDCILALGGGLVGDIAGFTAATLYRGIPFVQIPTTLLAQVDASVGGKTGVNHEKGKNLIGAFYQPKMVLIDPKVLKTLNMRERISGFAEVLKYGFIADKALLDTCIRQQEGILNLEDGAILQGIILRSLQIKAAIVEEDERETGKRMILNFGHTLGHALERSSHFSLRHGEAVIYGMQAALRLSVRFAGFDPALAEQYQTFLNIIPVPALPHSLNTEDLMQALLYDKKNRNRRLRFILLKSPGDPCIREDLPESAVRECAEDLINHVVE